MFVSNIKHLNILARIITIFVITFLLFHKKATAQKIFAIDKSGRIKRVQYYEGNEIELITKDGLAHNGIIASIKDSSLFINNNEIKLDSIKCVVRSSRYWLDLFGGTLALAGVGYLSLDSGNRLINDEKPYFHEKAIGPSLYLVGLGGVFSFLSKRKIKIKDRSQVKIIDLRIE